MDMKGPPFLKVRRPFIVYCCPGLGFSTLAAGETVGDMLPVPGLAGMFPEPSAHPSWMDEN